MRIILSPAKQMCVRSELPHGELPVFLHRSEELLQALQALSPLELRTLWKCSDRLVAVSRSDDESERLFSCKNLL